MNARPYRTGDGAAVDAIAPGHTLDLERDSIVVATSGNTITGVIACRPAVWVHELRLEDGSLRRRRAEELVRRGIEHIQDPIRVRDVLFMVERGNTAMLAFLRDLPYKLTEQPDAKAFWLHL